MTADASNITGYLESPERWTPRADAMAVGGWVFCDTSRIHGVDIVVNGRTAVPMVYGLSRDDVARRHGVAGARSGFIGIVPHDPDDGRATIRVECFVVFEGQRRVRWLERAVRMYDAGVPARLGRVAAAVADTMRIALRERRWPSGPQTWPSTIWRHWRGVPVAAPTTPRRPAPFEGQRLDESFRATKGAALDVRSAVSPAGPPVVVATLPDDPREVEPLCDSRGFWIPPGDGEYVVLLDSSTVPTPDGLPRVAQAIAANRADWVYTDDCRRDERGRWCDPYLKGAFSPELALFDDYATRLAVGRRDAIARVGGLDARLGQAAIHDLVLRLSRAGARIHHLPDVCAIRRAPVAAVLPENYRQSAGRVLSTGRGARARVEVGRDPAAPDLELPRVVWPDEVLDSLPVTIVIPTRDRVALLRRCIESLRRTVDFRRARLLIVDDRSRDRATLGYLRDLERRADLSCQVTRPQDPDGQFNYSRLMNHAAGRVETPLMLHVNNDVEAIAPGWLDQMAGWFSQPGVGIVGARLLFGDGSIQHAGVVVSPRDGIPQHAFGRLRASDPGYQWLPHRARNVSAVTGACLLTTTALFQRLGGFDATHLPVQFNDIDFCLRALAADHRIVYEPSAVLHHDQSASRGGAFDYRENAWFIASHLDYREPYVSPHFDPGSLMGPTPLSVDAEPNRTS